MNELLGFLWEALLILTVAAALLLVLELWYGWVKRKIRGDTTGM